MRNIVLLLLLVLLSCSSSQIWIASSHNDNYLISDFFEGIKYIEIIENEQYKDDIAFKPAVKNLNTAIYSYLYSIGFKSVGDSIVFSKKNVSSECLKGKLLVKYNYDNDYLYNFSLEFVSCQGIKWNYTFNNKLLIGNKTSVSSFLKYLKQSGIPPKNKFQSNKTLKLKRKKTEWNEKNLKTYFDKNPKDVKEGIYEEYRLNEYGKRYKFAIKKIKDKYLLLYLSNAQNYEDWDEGEIKARLLSTKDSNVYHTSWISQDKSNRYSPTIIFEPNFINLSWNGDNKLYKKIYPLTNKIVAGKKKTSQCTGTCFIIDKRGFFVTNYHVVEGGSAFKIKGYYNSNFVDYDAELISIDINNDLAILKVRDSSFLSPDTIPFNIADNVTNIGTKVYTLGFPMKNIMGSDIKMSTGIISSNSGYKGIIRDYQISSPIQPGNSGGPLFDYNGELIGIVNAKLANFEGVYYAIKSNYLKTMIQSIPENLTVPKSEMLHGKELIEQASILKNYIFSIEVK